MGAKNNLIGLSLSLCVQDIINGKVLLKRVIKIITRTAMATDDDVDHVISAYRDNAWRQNPEEGEWIARMLLRSGKVNQPRLYGRPIPDVYESGGHWVRSEDRIVWSI